MSSRLREPFGKAGLIVAIVALVAASLGGAYAATHHGKRHHKKKNSAGLNAKQKKQVRNIAKAEAKRFQGSGPAGPQGPAGAKGDNGSAGANGLDGTNGTNGTNGTDGKSVLVGETAPACIEGGINVEVEGSGVEREVCNGEEGPEGPEGKPWTAGGTLPVGSTETGSWSIGTYLGPTFTEPIEALNNPQYAPISFTIPLASALAGSKVHFVKKGEAAPAGCAGGTVAEPKAESGNLCVYTGKEEGPGQIGGIKKPSSSSSAAGADVSGALIEWLTLEEGVKAYGTWAVTG